jgi:peptide/nickel transport system substrate-binding protein/oligopeptide transport system substrate-binding protein
VQRRDFLSGGLVAGLGALGACGGPRAPARGGMLRVAVPGGFDAEASIDDPGAARTLITATTQRGLVGRDREGAIVPALARTWAVTDDGLAYMFRLRPNLTRADGSPIEASAVVDRLKRARADAAVRPELRPLMALTGITSPAPGMVQLDLAQPNPALLGWLALPALAIAPRGANPPASGPFALADVNVRELRLTPNAAYHDAARVRVGEVRVEAVGDAASAIARFRDGKADIVTGAAIDGLVEARATGRSALQLEPCWGAYGLRVARSSALLRDAQVRRALALAIDRGALISRQFGALAGMVPAPGPVPPNLSSPGDAPPWAAAPVEERRAQAATLLRAAGWSPEVTLDLVAAIPPGEEHAAIISEVAAQLAPLGLRLRVMPLPPADMAAAAIVPEGVDLVATEIIAPVDDPAWFVASLWPEHPEPWTDAARDQLAGSDMWIGLLTPVRWSLVRAGIDGWVGNIAGVHPLELLDVSPAR